MSGKHYTAKYKSKRTGRNTHRRTVWLATEPEIIKKMDIIAERNVRTLPELIRIICIAHFGLTTKERLNAKRLIRELEYKT